MAGVEFGYLEYNDSIGNTIISKLNFDFNIDTSNAMQVLKNTACGLSMLREAGIAENETFNNRINIAPNPTHNEATINIDNIQCNGENYIEIYDMNDKMFLSKMLSPTCNAVISTVNFPSRVYITKLKVNENYYTKRFIKL